MERTLYHCIDFLPLDVLNDFAHSGTRPDGSLKALLDTGTMLCTSSLLLVVHCYM